MIYYMNPQDPEQFEEQIDEESDDDHGVIVISDPQIESLVKKVKYCILAIAVALVIVGLQLWG